MEDIFLSDIEKQIMKERAEKYAELDKMSEQERIAYLQEKSRRVQEYAEKIGMETITIKIPKNNGEGK